MESIHDQFNMMLISGEGDSSKLVKKGGKTNIAKRPTFQRKSNYGRKGSEVEVGPNAPINLARRAETAATTSTRKQAGSRNL